MKILKENISNSIMKILNESYSDRVYHGTKTNKDYSDIRQNRI